MSGGYPLDAALQYLAGGWQPLPLLSGGKGLVPASRTGYDGLIVTEADVRRWAGQHHDGLCLRLVDAIGLDVDAYDPQKDAVGTLADLTRRLGPAPLTVRVSARFGPGYDGMSGIRLFRLPEQYAQTQLEPIWRTGFDGIDLIRFGHRQCVAWPSRHPSRGTTYGFADERDGSIHYSPLPPLASLPELPPAWVEACIKRSAPTGPPITITATDLPTGTMCRATEKVLADILTGTRRHDDWLLAGATRLARLAEQGHQTGDAWQVLHDTFISAVTTTGDHPRTPAEAESEWQRGVNGIRLTGTTPATERGCCRTRSTLADLRAQIRRKRP